MALSVLSITRLARGDIDGLPLQLQILDIHRLNGDVAGLCLVRLKLSDGKNYYTGFIIDMSMFNSLGITVYAIVRIGKLLVLKDLLGKQVLHIVHMQLVCQENKCIGEPEPCQYQSTQTMPSVLMQSVSRNMLACSTSQQPVHEVERTRVIQEPTSIVQLSATHTTETVIEGRVIRKSQILNYSNGTGKFFTFDLADCSAGIRCKAFNDVANIFIDQIVLGNAYHLNNFIINRANKQYNHLSHDFEINLIKDTVIYSIHDEAYTNVDVSFNVTKIIDISLEDIGKCFDLLVKIESIGEADSIFITKKKSFSYKRLIKVLDDNHSTNVVLWGDLAKDFTGQVNQIMTAKDLVAQNFKGQLQFASTMMTIVRFQQ